MVTSTSMDGALFRALPLPSDAEGAACKRLLDVARAFELHFGSPPAGVARAPGRVNLIGEHVDYEGYAVLPMAIEQSVFVAFNAISKPGSSGAKVLSVANAKPQYRAVSLAMDADEQESMQQLEKTEGTRWTKYVLCGVLGIQDANPELFKGQEKELQMLVDGDVSAGCGLSSSSALVVAAALATYSALQTLGDQPLGRMELAELCRRAEHRVGTMGGGMDQAVACLAEKGVALHLDFATVPATSSPVRVPDDAAGVTFVVANSLVVAQKAVDAATRFNKRVVECALASKMIAKKAGIDGWRDINRLVDVHEALGSASGVGDLLKLVMNSCNQKEYALAELEAEFGEPLAGLFTGPKLETAAQAVIASATSFKLQQRALHVWGEVERVKQFRSICASLAKTPSPSDREKWQAFTTRESLQNLGVTMNGSHQSCRTLYECSCPELDALYDAALSAGALGARLTGAGWGGCIVALVQNAEVATFMKAIETSYYKERGVTPAEANDAMFESAPASGADIFMLQSK